MDSMQVLGKELDENAMSPALQTVVAKAAQFGVQLLISVVANAQSFEKLAYF